MPEPIAWKELGLCSYAEGLELQDELWRTRCDGGSDVALLLEHPPTITFGRRATDAELRVSRPDLTARGIGCVQADRGGLATYHGPGQLVLYPIVALRERSLLVGCFVWVLEESMIRTAAHYGVDATRDARGRGVWVNGRKLGAVGIRVRRHVTTHGLALNVDPDLEAFALIVPCGMPDAAPTSLARECGRALRTDEVAPVLREAFEAALTERTARACEEARP